jgi:hypothetical protein
MKGHLRKVLADSHVAAVTIAVLLMWVLDAAFRGLWYPAYDLGAFVLTGIAIWDIPYISPTLTVADRLMLITTGYFVYSAIVCFFAAWLLSRWVYGMGPLRSLTTCGRKLIGGKNA